MSVQVINNGYDWVVNLVVSKYASRHNKDDIQQECWLALIECCKKCNPDSPSFARFAYTCSKNRVINYLRSEKKHKRILQIEDRSSQKDKLWECIPDMSMQDRLLINMILNQTPIADIAEHYNLSPSTIYNRKRYIYNKIRKAIK